jgi:exosortase/archaeosortase family protein
MLILPKSFYKFLAIFFITFASFYYGFNIIYGAAIPGGYYSSFVHNYFNIASWIRQGLMFCTHQFLYLLNVDSFKESEYILRYSNGVGIKLIYGCLGIAVYCFWIAYTVASVTNFKKKIAWLLLGLFLLWNINVVRISLVFLALINKWSFPFGIDQHTWFNIVAYIFIFMLIFFFEKSITIVGINQVIG